MGMEQGEVPFPEPAAPQANGVNHQETKVNDAGKKATTVGAPSPQKKIHPPKSRPPPAQHLKRSPQSVRVPDKATASDDQQNGHAQEQVEGAREAASMDADDAKKKGSKADARVSKNQNGRKSGTAASTPERPGSPGRGFYLLKLAKSGHISGDKPTKTLDYASRAAEVFESFSEGETPSLELVMSLHIVAAAYCRMGKYEDAVEALERTLSKLPNEFVSQAGIEYLLAAFAGHMQLGDTYVKLGKQDRGVQNYGEALRIQKQALGDMDPQVGETCRYLAEAYLQTMRFKEAQELCEHVLKIHAERSAAGSVQEAVDRRLMAMILSGKGDHEQALEHLVLASTAMSSHNQDMNVASIDASIGDCYSALGRYDEAAFSYQKALASFKQLAGENHASVASIYVSLGELSLATGKNREAKAYAENALQIYGKEGTGHTPEELAAGLTDLAGIYDAMNEPEHALSLLQNALGTMEKVTGGQRAAAGIQAQMGVLYYNMGKFSESYANFASSISRLKDGAEYKSPVQGILLHQMALALFELNDIGSAVKALEEAQDVLAETCGVHHPDTIAACSSLAAGYDALGRVDEAIDLLEKVVQSQEERLGTAHPDVVDERHRLEQILKEVGRPLIRKTSTLEELLMLPGRSHSRRFHHKLV